MYHRFDGPYDFLETNVTTNIIRGDVKAEVILNGEIVRGYTSATDHTGSFKYARNITNDPNGIFEFKLLTINNKLLDRECYSWNGFDSPSNRAIDCVLQLQDLPAPPTFYPKPESMIVQSSNPLGAIVEYTKPIPIYESPIIDTNCSPPSGTLFPIGVTTVTCTARDAAGNIGTASFDVTILAWDDISDKTPPTISASNDITEYTSFSRGAIVTYPVPSAFDNSGLNSPILCMPMSGSLFLAGTTTVTCTATDTVGNTATSNFNVKVIILDDDTEPPTFSETENITKLALNSSGTSVQYFTPTAFDNSPLDGNVTCTPSSGSLFPVGVTTVTCTATDTVGNIGVTSFYVTVILYNEGGN